RSIADAGTRSDALAALAPHLPERDRAAVLSQPHDAARSIGSEGDRSRTLAALAPHLPAELLSEALDTAFSIGQPQVTGVVGVLRRSLRQPLQNLAPEPAHLEQTTSCRA